MLPFSLISCVSTCSLHMARPINYVAVERVPHVRDILREFLGHNVSGIRTLKPKNLLKTF